jgi:hypothetical protein
MSDVTIQVSRLTGGCGAEVSGVDLARISDRQWQEVRRAFVEHGVIFFRDQHLTPEEHIAFARRWGPIDINRFFKPVEGHPEIAEVRKEKTQTTNIGGGWHTDHSYDEAPAMGSILLAREVPAEGGDTLFASMYAAYESLSEGLRRTLDGMRAIHSDAHVFGARGHHKQVGETADRIGNAHAPRVGPACALRQSGLHAALRRLVRGRQQAAAGAPLPACDAAGIHLPVPLDAGRRGVLGQSRHLALCCQRLSWRAPPDASHHGRGPPVVRLEVQASYPRFGRSHFSACPTGTPRRVAKSSTWSRPMRATPK